MFLAIREIRKYKLRYSLIGVVLVLIAYLIFVLTGLANGLAASNRTAIDSWDANQIVLNEDANGSLTQSTLNQQQADHFNQSNQAALVQLNANVNRVGHQEKTGAQILGIKANQFISRKMKIEQGRKFRNNHEVVVDDSLLKNDGYRIGDFIKIASHRQKYQIVGSVSNNQLSVAPVIYGSLTAVQQMKFGTTSQAPISAVVIKDNAHHKAVNGTTTLAMNDFINKLPGYTAQNNTFNFMIGFLLVITLFIVAIFLYVLTIQKIPYLAVMKVQGISNGYLVRSIIGQAAILGVIGVLISGGLTAITVIAIPSSVPIQFNYLLMGSIAVLLVIMTIVGALIPIRTVTKIDPATVIGG
ncbi:ABC transporter permease [Nicoliella lavandulae]|uniref:Putative hemin transport system permease protein HrtB n=1 Tax=Nicoliella lavandulae TaxID=3082954 RepID=A0ABU8SJQ0_9LACO